MKSRKKHRRKKRRKKQKDQNNTSVTIIPESALKHSHVCQLRFGVGDKVLVYCGDKWLEGKISRCVHNYNCNGETESFCNYEFFAVDRKPSYTRTVCTGSPCLSGRNPDEFVVEWTERNVLHLDAPDSAMLRRLFPQAKVDLRAFEIFKIVMTAPTAPLEDGLNWPSLPRTNKTTATLTEHSDVVSRQPNWLKWHKTFRTYNKIADRLYMSAAPEAVGEYCRRAGVFTV